MVSEEISRNYLLSCKIDLTRVSQMVKALEFLQYDSFWSVLDGLNSIMICIDFDWSDYQLHVTTSKSVNFA